MDKNKLLHWYLIIFLIFGVLGLVDSLYFVVLKKLSVFSWVLGVLSLLWFLLSIAALVYFIAKKIKPIYLLFPIYTVGMYFLLFLYGIIYALITKSVGMPGSDIIALVTSLIEVIAASYVLFFYK